MCGRTACTLDPNLITKIFGANGPIKNVSKYKMSFNAAPSSFQPVLIFDHEGIHVHVMHWGFQGWSSHLIINARGETIHQKPTFQRLLEKNRCAIVADGFYEWKKIKGEHKESKQPYFIHYPFEKPMTFAGVFSTSINNAMGEIEESYVIATVASNPALSHVHERMPAILSEEDLEHWIDPTFSVDKALDLLKPFSGELKVIPLSSSVNSASNDGPELIVEAPEIKEEDEGKKNKKVIEFFKPQKRTKLENDDAGDKETIKREGRGEEEKEEKERQEQQRNLNKKEEENF